MTDTRPNGDPVIPSTYCPACGKLIDTAMRASGAPAPAPKRGDFGVCFQCAQPFYFEEAGRVRPMTRREQKRLSQADQKLLAGVREAVQRFRSRN